MATPELSSIIDHALADRWLLEHPFYRRWENGEVTMPELAGYAAQYRHFEAYLPGFLERLVDELPAGAAQDLIAANLSDEQGDPVPHVELFEQFAAGVGAPAAEPSPAMAALLGTYDALLAAGPDEALAGFLAYEYQAADVAANKAAGLCAHYGLGGTATAFWEHHAAVDITHRQWALSAARELSASPATLSSSLRRAGAAWWGFLDERQALGEMAA